MTFVVGDKVRVDNGGEIGNYEGEGTIVGVYPDFVMVKGLWDDRIAPFAFDFAHERVHHIAGSAPELLPADSESRKGIPLTTGLLDYFSGALREVAKVSKAGNDKHNPGQPLHWARGKSMDQADAIARHLLERGYFDPDTGLRQSAHLAWRALALLQLELEEAGEAPRARGAGE